MIGDERLASISGEELPGHHANVVLADEIAYQPHSFADPTGRVFSWGGGLYRGLRGDATPFFRKLFEQGTVRQLVDRGLLVDSELTDLRLEGYEMVVKHRRVQFPSYPAEWCASMLRDAALSMVDLLLDLDLVGLTLKDGHPWNVVFDGSRPLFVDLGSIAPASGSQWQKAGEFRRYCYYPLVLMAYAREPIGRCLLAEDDGAVPSDLALIPASVRHLTRLRHLSWLSGRGVVPG